MEDYSAQGGEATSAITAWFFMGRRSALPGQSLLQRVLPFWISVHETGLKRRMKMKKDRFTQLFGGSCLPQQISAAVRRLQKEVGEAGAARPGR